ncbi:MAG: aspartate kinase, partial [Candidatus Xenobia bacterium]
MNATERSPDPLGRGRSVPGAGPAELCSVGEPSVRNPGPRILVLKFGGTSVATTEGRQQAVARVQEVRNRGFLPVVVVSAMGRRGAPYATDTLLELVSAFNGAASRRDLDLLMSCGESISIVVFACELRAAGVPAVALTGFQAGIVTTEAHGDAIVRHIETARVRASLGEGRVPVVAGFQGITEGGDVTTLGRGGSDTTAVALGCALQAGGVVIYTDVDGVLTADPRVLPEARTLPEVTYEEAGELSIEGARVLHPRCVDLAAQYKVPLWVRATSRPDGGTRIAHEMPRDAFEKTRVATSIVSVPGVVRVEVATADAALRVRMFGALAEAGVSLDVINTTPREVFFIVHANQAGATFELLDTLQVSYRRQSGCAKVSIVGIGMRGTPGVMARIQQALLQAGVEV